MRYQDQELYERGKKFEEYVENVVFSQRDYHLVEKTHSYDQNSKRFVESSMRPDYKFRSRLTNQEFYVEAKYRTQVNSDDKVEILTQDQFSRFQNLDKKECPVFLIIGLGGKPYRPDLVSLIPLGKIQYLALYKSVLYNNRIEGNRSYDARNIDHYINSIIIANESVSQPKAESPEQPNKKTIFNVKPILLIIIGLTLAVLLFFLIQSLNKEELTSEINLRSQIGNYYQSLEINNTEALTYFINESVDRWYKDFNVSLEFIKRDAEAYNKKFPHRKIVINWDTYKESILPNGDYNVSYDVMYRIKPNINIEFETYHLNIKAIWDKNLKLRSMYEVKL